MTTRNEETSHGLRMAYEHLVPDWRLAIFCVSNRDYRKNRNSPRDISRPILELSGIIQLRKHCISIVSDSQLRNATMYMKQKVPALLDSLQLWVQSGSGSLDAQQKQAVHRTLDEVEQKLQQVCCLDRTSVAITKNPPQELTQPSPGIDGSEMEKLFDRYITEEREVEYWVKGASQAAFRWSRVRKPPKIPFASE